MASHQPDRRSPAGRTGNQRGAAQQAVGLLVVRYGVGAVMVTAGLVMIVVNPGGSVGGGLSVLLVNFLFRLGVSGDLEREREEEARRYLEEHGVWPEEEERPRGRAWTLPAGARTWEDEQAERQAQRRDPEGAGRREEG